jgi:acyl dehydratase
VVHVGEEVPNRDFVITRADVRRFAEASGDFNPIHLSDEAAQAAGFDGLVAHGLYTLALATRALTEWAGSLTVVAEIGTRFTRPVVVPVEGTVLTVGGTVLEVLRGGLVRVEFKAFCQGKPVIARARATVRMP